MLTLIELVEENKSTNNAITATTNIFPSKLQQQSHCKQYFIFYFKNKFQYLVLLQEKIPAFDSHKYVRNLLKIVHCTIQLHIFFYATKLSIYSLFFSHVHIHCIDPRCSQWPIFALLYNIELISFFNYILWLNTWFRIVERTKCKNTLTVEKAFIHPTGHNPCIIHTYKGTKCINLKSHNSYKSVAKIC